MSEVDEWSPFFHDALIYLHTTRKCLGWQIARTPRLLLSIPLFIPLSILAIFIMTMLSFVLVNIFLLLAPCIHGPGGVAASSVTFYSDTGCTTLIANTTAQDGFPDGQCTNLTASVNQTFASFLISSLDEGCSGRPPSSSPSPSHSPIDTYLSNF